MQNALAFTDPRLQQAGRASLQAGAAQASSPVPDAPLPSANALAPKALPQNPFRPAPMKPQNTLLESAVSGFQRGFDPKGYQAGQDKAKADQAEALKIQIATLKNIRAMPLEQRMQVLPQLSQQIGKDIPPELMQDQAIDSHLALMMGEAGMAPEAPEPKNPIIIGNNAYDPETYQPIIQGEAKPNLPDGWQMGENGPEPIPGYAEWYRKIHPGDSQGSGSQFVDVPPAEMEALGYPKGTLGQRNTKTNEIQIKSRPSTQMTGQPTESERKYAFYAKNAKHGLDVVNSMETKQGFNRADGWTWATSWTNQNARSYDQGMSQFIDSWLRAMTGAAATPSEIEFYKQQWTPQLGDGPDVIKQKRDARNQAVVDMEAAAGRGLPQGSTPAPVASESAPAGPTFPDGTPITPETLQQLPPELRQFWERKLPAQQADPTDEAFIDGLFSDQGAGDQVPDGVDPQDWQYMTPEERALFQ